MAADYSLSTITITVMAFFGNNLAKLTKLDDILQNVARQPI